MADSSHSKSVPPASGSIPEEHLTMREAVKTAAASVADSAGTATEQIKEESVTYLSRQKEAAAEELGHLSKAVFQAAETLRSEHDNRLAEYVDLVANGMERVSNRLRNTNFAEVMQSCQEVTRRRPELVYGGLFLAGLVVSRFLKAAPSRAS